MRIDGLVWFGRMVAVIFATGVIGLVALVTMLVRQAEGVPPMPLYLGLLGFVALTLLATVALALVSIAVTLRRMSRAGPVLSGVVPSDHDATVTDEVTDTPTISVPLERPMQGPPLRATRGTGPALVARR